jgi:glucose/arabinose dehydrogenase
VGDLPIVEWVVEDGRVGGAPFLDVSDRITAGGEQGLLSIAFHPGYEENGRFYVNYTNREGDTRVVEYRVQGGRTRVDAGSGSEILAVDQPYSNHNGGQLMFGPDGLLYVGMGDGGSGGDPENRAQDLQDRLGKLLRLDVDDPDAEWEIVAYGLRNPWRFSFDRETGDLYLGDVGQGDWEEVDYVPRSVRGLVNFGWDVFEGRARYEDKDPNPEGRLVAPVAVYPLREGGNCSVVGGFVYRGEAIPSIRGRYFYGDYCAGWVESFRIRGGKAAEQRRERFSVEGLTSFGEDEAGELYLVSHTGTVSRLVAE